MFDVPLQLTEEKKHYPTAPKKMNACEKCVYGSGEHTCVAAPALGDMCRCGHSFGTHNDRGCVSSDYCECEGFVCT